ncbi:MAG: MFS transporter [candidate division Zixibacteria bacterium]|nr:MFS transporter [candidate division Zixibacteria bacterium]
MSPTTGSLWRRDIVGWSLYDFANTIYSMNIVSLYLKRYIVEDLGYGDRYYDIPFSISMAFAALVLPALGAMSDHATRKKLFLLLFTISCCVASGLLSIVPSGMIVLTLALFMIANFSYEAGQPFYNALLYSVAEGRQARLVSGIGVSLGYVGSILGMILVLPFVTGELFGWDVPFLDAGGKVAAFLPTAVLFFLFALPVFLWVRERPLELPGPMTIRAGYRDVWEGIRETKKYPGVLRFLIADYFFEDAVATVIINIGLYCSLVIGMTDEEITLFLIVSTASAVIGSYVIGLISRAVSLKRLVRAIVVGWIAALLLFVAVENRTVIWLLGSVVGVLLGGLWTTTRPMLGELVPHDRLGRFFGLFSLSGRAAAVVGPLIWTAVVYLFHPAQPLGAKVSDVLNLPPDSLWLPYKTAVLALALLMAIGLFIFRKVPDTHRGPHAQTAR